MNETKTKDEDAQKKYEELRAKVLVILDNLDNIGFQIQGGAKQAKAEILGVQPRPANRAERRRQARKNG